MLMVRHQIALVQVTLQGLLGKSLKPSCYSPSSPLLLPTELSPGSHAVVTIDPVPGLLQRWGRCYDSSGSFVVCI